MSGFILRFVILCALAWPARLLAASPANCANLTAYGGSISIADNTPALEAAVAAATQGNPCVYIPPGTYKFASSYAYVFGNATASFTLKGDGPDVSQLDFTGASGGLTFNYRGYNNAVHIRELSIVTTSASSQTGVTLNQGAAVANPALGEVSDFLNVTLRGTLASPGTSFWGTAINIISVSNVNFTGLNIIGQVAAYSTKGQGIVISGTTSAIPVQFNITQSAVQFVNAGIVYGAPAQGLTVSQTNFSGNSYGILVPAGNDGIDQLAVSDSQFNCSLAGISTQSLVVHLMAHGNIFIAPNTGVGIQLAQAGLFSLIGNSFNNVGTNGAVYPIGIVVNGSTYSGVISGNNFNRLNMGIELQAGSSNVNVQSNAYSNTALAVTNAGTNNTLGGGSL